MSSNEELDRVNDEMANTLLPAIVLVIIYMVLGLFGNPLVAYYYGCRAKATSSYHFIVALSIFDLITCCVSMPLEIVDIRKFYKFENTIACKILRFVNYFASVSSGAILIAIAVDRYRKVCHPFNKQITLRLTKLIIAVACVFSVCVSWPSFIFYGSHEVNVTSVPGLKGNDCTTIRDDSYKIYITIYNIVLFVCFLGAITSLIVLYCLVGRRLMNLKSFQFYAAKPKSKDNGATSHNSSDQTSTGMFSRSSSKIIEIPDEIEDKPLATIKELDPASPPGSVSSSRANSITQGSARSEHRIHPESIRKQSTLSDIKFNSEISGLTSPKGVSSISINFPNDTRNGSAMSSYSDRSRSTRQGSATSEQSRVSGLSEYSDSDFVQASETRDAKSSVDVDQSQQKLQAQNIDTKKYTIIMLSISIAFIVSFLPYLGLVTWRTLAVKYEVDLLSDSGLIAYQIFIRSFLISSAVNPLIYGFLNNEFRQFVTTLFRKCCCCCCYNKKQTENKTQESQST